MIADARYIEGLWRRFLVSPELTPTDWRNAFEFIRSVYGDPYAARPISSGGEFAVTPGYLPRFGHLHADLDPLGLAAREPLPSGLARRRDAPGAGADKWCGTMAVETGHLDSPDIVDWIGRQVERGPDPAGLDRGEVLAALLRTEIFDQFLATKFPGKKRFGSEGADAVLPLLHEIARVAEAGGADGLVIGSMHRGRLSIMANFCRFDLASLLALFRGAHPFPDDPSLPGDVPYHLGWSGAVGGLHTTLLPNPSHLEAVNPVAIGYARARRSAGGDVLPLVLHTDASVVAQGVNAELLQMSGLDGYEVGGTVHVVINNQIGFTTDPHEARSARYCTAQWRAVDSLIVHVNGNDVDAVLQAGRLALAFRDRFQRDAVIDLVCYRANGHNEMDEPRFTQPAYYQVADTLPKIAAAYGAKLLASGVVESAEIASLRRSLEEELDTAFARGASPVPPAAAPRRRAVNPPGEALLRRVTAAVADVPLSAGHPKIVKLLARRSEELDSGITWPHAEALAMGVLLDAGVSVRLSGQDVERGSFSQRHLAIVDPATGRRQWPLAELARDGARLEVLNSPLSEYAVLGFEYGHSLAAEDTLTIWEAQFGDFANGAQIVLDQFIASGGEKWRQSSNIAVLLPHGLEGQGPEHSSARIERLLHLCARDNLRVAHPSTPANFYHLLLEQAGADQPLLALTPKVLLRLPEARSQLSDFVDAAGFRPVIGCGRRGARRAVLCAGKLAYELERAREAAGADVAIIRIEQYYPFPEDALRAALAALGATEIVWAQEEPANMGAGAWLGPRIEMLADAIGASLQPMVARPASASPAGSFHGRHDEDQRALHRRALGVEAA